MTDHEDEGHSFVRPMWLTETYRPYRWTVGMKWFTFTPERAPVCHRPLARLWHNVVGRRWDNFRWGWLHDKLFPGWDEWT